MSSISAHTVKDVLQILNQSACKNANRRFLYSLSQRELREKIKRTTETDGSTQGKDFPIKTNTLAKYYPPLGKYDADRINKSIAKFMAVCGVPFAVAKKESFKEMLKELNPAFVHVNHLKSRDTYRRKFLPTMVAQRFLCLVLLDELIFYRHVAIAIVAERYCPSS